MEKLNIIADISNEQNFGCKNEPIIPIDVMEISIKNMAGEIKQTLPADGYAVLFADETAESLVSAYLLSKALSPDKLHAIVINHGLSVYKTEKELVEELRNLGFTKIHISDAGESIFGIKNRNTTQKENSVSIVTSPLSVKSFVKRKWTEAQDEAYKSIDLPQDKIFVVDFSSNDKNGIKPAKPQYANLKNNDILTEPIAITKARDENRVIFTNKHWSCREIKAFAKYICEKKQFSRAVNCSAHDISELIHVSKPIKRVNLNKLLELKDLISDYEFASDLAPITSVESSAEKKRIFKHPMLIATNKHSLRDVMHITRMIPSNLNFINRILVRIDGTDLPESPANYGLRVRPKTVSVAKAINRIVMERLNCDSIASCKAILIPLAKSKEAPGSCVIRAKAYGNSGDERTAIPGIDFDENILTEIAKEIKHTCPRIGMVFYEATPHIPKTTNAL